MIHLTLWEICCVGLAVFIASNLWFYLRVLRPIQQLANCAVRLSQGDLDAFNDQCDGIAEIRQLRRALMGMVGHVRRAQDQGRAYSAQLTSGQEYERKRLAHELHDDTVQSLISITQSIDIAKTFIASDIDRATALLGDTREQAVAIVTRLRDLIAGLRPPALEELGLIPALKMQFERVSVADIQLTVAGQVRRLDEAYELVLFRAAQEGLTNAERHGKAEQITIHMDYQADGVTLSIQDDGRGFQPPSDLGNLVLDQHYGLVGIQERIGALDGTLTVDSTPGNGTSLHIFLPTHPQQQPDDLVQDPVCRAWIAPDTAYASLTYSGTQYYFCCPVCQGAFQKDPTGYVHIES